MNKLKNIFNLISNMGMRFVLFRVTYEIRKRSGLLKRAYPISYNEKEFISIHDWRKSAPKFFFDSRESLGNFNLTEKGKQKLIQEFELIKSGKLKFFSSTVKDLGADYDWVTNPDTGYKYDKNQHWTEIPDFSPERGDIKYVWEKSRFSYLYTIIRYDKHFKEDQSDYVLNQITDWIDKNPLNCGPNYVCSQETSLRVLNWTFALYYYKNSHNLTEERFSKILNSIYWQIKHVEQNINFSRIAVRNNHAMTESLMMYLSNILFPFFKSFKKTSLNGAKYLKEEALFQIDKDGAYLQYTNNYHRIVIQLYTWYFKITEANGLNVDSEIYERLKKSYLFLYEHQNVDGRLPNYGVNDGALFFPLNSTEYFNYKGALNGMNFFYEKSSLYQLDDSCEDIFWYYGSDDLKVSEKERTSLKEYKNDGYYIARKDNGTFLTLKCGSFRSRPAHADNLHLDYWSDGVNILRDSGMYKYNTDFDVKIFFWGTRGHNTIMIDGADQMQKGPRFNWYNWSNSEFYKCIDTEEYYLVEGKIHAFKHVGDDIKHHRKIKYFKKEERIEVEDFIENTTLEKELIWNPNPDFDKLGFSMRVYDEKGNVVDKKIKKGYYTDYYGEKSEVDQWSFISKKNYFKTVITKNAL